MNNNIKAIKNDPHRKNKIFFLEKMVHKTSTQGKQINSEFKNKFYEKTNNKVIHINV
jgi:hypothetical protein